MNSSHGRTPLFPLMLLVHQAGLSLCIEQGEDRVEGRPSGLLEPLHGRGVIWKNGACLGEVGVGGWLSLGSVSSEPVDDYSYQHVTQSKQ